MKKYISGVMLIACYILLGIPGYSQYTDAVPWKVKNAFTLQFRDATAGPWRLIQDTYVASINYQNQEREVYFTEEGIFRGEGHYITPDNLPLKVKQTLDREFAGFQQNLAFEYTCQTAGLCYFVSLENEKYKVDLRLTPQGTIVFEQNSRIKNVT